MRALGIVVVFLVVGTVALRLLVTRVYRPLRGKRRVEEILADNERLDQLLERDRIRSRRK